MKYLPIKFHILYVLGTVLFSFFGPREYQGYNKVPVFIFMFFYLVLAALGFHIGIKFKVQNIRIKSFIKPLSLFKISLIVCSTLYLYNIYHLYSAGNLTLDLSSMGSNYIEFYKEYGEKKKEGLFTYEILFLVAVAIPKFIILGFGFFYYKRLSLYYKLLLIGTISMIILSHTIAMGNQKSIGDIAIFGLIGLLLSASKLRKKKRKLLLFRSIVILISLFIFLSYSQYSRFDSTKSITVKNFNKLMHGYSNYNPDHLIFRLLGDKAGLGVSHFITGYLSGGYYGLSLSMSLPFKWTYGVGSSVGLSTIYEKTTGNDVYERSYLGRIEEQYGVPGKKHWHTIFPWIASDVTFPGVLFLFLIIAFIYGRSWKEVLLYKNPVSLLMFSLLTIMFIFVPANNQIFHGYDYISITIFVSVYWMLYHNKYNHIHEALVPLQKI